MQALKNLYFFCQILFIFLVVICAYLCCNKYMEVLLMKLTCAGTKKSPTYYIQKTIRIGNKTTTKTVERLGNIEEIKARCGDQDPIEWAKEYAKKLTIAEKEAKKGILLKLSSSMLIDKNVRNSCNAGYLFLQDIYYPLGLDKICTSISKKINSIMT